MLKRKVPDFLVYDGIMTKIIISPVMVVEEEGLSQKERHDLSILMGRQERNREHQSNEYIYIHIYIYREREIERY